MGEDHDDLEVGLRAHARKEEENEDLAEDEEEGSGEGAGKRYSVCEVSTFSIPETHYDADDGCDDHGNDDEENEEDSDESDKKPPAPLRPALRRELRFKKKSSILRHKRSVDVETGEAEEHVIQCQAVDDELYFSPMNPSDRWWKMAFRRKNSPEVVASPPWFHREEPVRQYRLTSCKTGRGLQKYLRMAISDDFHANQGLNSLIADYLVWTFQTNIVIVFLASSSFYVLFILIFGIAIYIAGRHQPECIDVGNLDFRSSGHYLMDAFSLSWQTMSTAGYGVIYPAIDVGHKQYCIGLNMLTALESFWGVIFVGCITAIIFSKMVRVQAVAAVEFCDPLVVRYGPGVMPVEDDDIFSQMSSTDAEQTSEVTASRGPRQKNNSNMDSMFSRRSMVRDSQCPCPVLEFRLINRLHDHPGGEICNAGVNVVAVTSALRASMSIRESVGMGKRHLAEMNRKQKHTSIKKTIQTSGTILRNSAYRAGAVTGAVLQKSGDTILRKSGAASIMQKSVAVIQKLNSTLTSVPEAQSVNESHQSPRKNRDGVKQQPSPLPVSVIEKSRRHLAVDEEPSSSLVPRRIFSKLEIETDRHPFFKRVWNIRHVLNENSPLLSNEAKRLIQENHGFWPAQLNSYEKVRKHIHFHEIIVNFSGTSNVSGATVYSQKLYLFTDLNVGYRFAQVLFKSATGRLIVDSRLLNDVTEQYGGGAEPLTNVIDPGDVRLNTDLAVDVAKAAARVTAEVALTSADAAVRVAQSTAAVASSVARATTGVAQATADTVVIATGSLRPSL